MVKNPLGRLEARVLDAYGRTNVASLERQPGDRKVIKL